MSSRADRRRERRAVVSGAPAATAGRPHPAAAAPGDESWKSSALRIGALLALAAVLLVHWRWYAGRITWYLAVDQFGYYAFARDILSGRLFHEWAPANFLGPRMLPRSDVLAQAYIFDEGRIYSRYAPGFPLLLAAWMALFGEARAHDLNAICFCAMMGVAALLVRRLTGSWWRGVAAAALVAICPLQIHWWGATLTRDAATHLVAWTGLCLLLPRRARRLGDARSTAGALALGFAASMRPDAAMYLVPGGLIAISRARREGMPSPRHLARLGGAWAAGILPLLAYDVAATGSPLPPQAIEIKPLFESLARAVGGALVGTAWAQAGWHGGIWHPVQGGAWDPANFPRVIVEQVAGLRAGYGPVLALLGCWGAITSFFLRRRLWLVLVPYAAVALAFFSCWVRADARYLIGFHLAWTILVVEGVLSTIEILRRLEQRGAAPVAQGLAVFFATGLLLGAGLAPAGRPPLPAATWICALVGSLAALATLAFPARRIVRYAAPALGLALGLLSIANDLATTKRTAAIQGAEIAMARANVTRELPANAVVLTTEDIGRPLENLEIYADRRAIYTTDLQRWKQMLPIQAAARSIVAGRRFFLLLPSNTVETYRVLDDLREGDLLSVTLVRKIPATRNKEWFVAAPFHKGIGLGLWEVTERRPGSLATFAPPPTAAP